MAENYLQHAEHYFRIVSSAQQAMNGPRDGQSGDEVDFDDDANDVNSRFSSPQPVQHVQNGNESEAEGSQPEAQASQPVEEAAAAPEAEGEQAPRKPRERRPRRRRPAGGEGATDPGSAPQPDLPAFLTGNPAE